MVKIHGNWCGPNWTGGQRVASTDYKGSWDYPAIDALDKACRAHDLSCSKGSCSRKADTALITAARKRILSTGEAIKLNTMLLNPFLSRSRRQKIVKRLEESSAAELVVAGISIARPFRRR